MIAITTSSSTSVKPPPLAFIRRFKLLVGIAVVGHFYGRALSDGVRIP